MKRIILFLYVLICSACSINGTDWRNSPFFDTKFLSKYDAVAQYLMEQEGCVEGFFRTEDNVLINYLWLKRPHARYTMIYCSGFFPGRKEGLATFHALMPEDCNLLFFDARGHGKSGGRFLSRIWGYGAQEYKDVIGAIHFAAKQQRCPIFLYGVCAGAFHATHALLQLQKRGMLHHALQIKGLIFDSGWSSIADVSRTAFVSEIDGVLRKRCSPSGWTYTVLSPVAAALVRGAHSCFVRPVLYWRRKEMSLADKIEQIDIPILYVHAQNDQYATIEPVKALAERTQQAKTWWIAEPSKHACHHLKCKEQYRERLLSFIEDVL